MFRPSSARVVVAVALTIVAVAFVASSSFAVAQRLPVGPVLGPVPVLRVLDGDTVVLRSNLGPRVVRLIGIDTPEVSHPEKGRERFGPEASAFTEALLSEGTRVWVELDLETEDAYGRLLAYLYLPDADGDWSVAGQPAAMVNEEIARAGFARVLTIPPNGVYADLFEAAVDQARAAGAGMFAPATDDAVPRAETERVTGGSAGQDRTEGAIRITCVNYDPSAPADENAEWVELRITEPVDTRGMYLYDAGSKERFPLEPGVRQPGTIRIVNPGKGIWNNSGDTVYLMRGPSEIVDEFTYEPIGVEDRPVCRE